MVRTAGSKLAEGPAEGRTGGERNPSESGQDSLGSSRGQERRVGTILGNRQAPSDFLFSP